MTQILHQLIGNLVTPIIYQMFFLFKESQVVISRGILSPFATKNLIFLFQAAVSTELLELKVFSVPVGLLVVLLVARKTW